MSPAVQHSGCWEPRCETTYQCTQLLHPPGDMYKNRCRASEGEGLEAGGLISARYTQFIRCNNVYQGDLDIRTAV